jgi:hypothetical protein
VRDTYRRFAVTLVAVLLIGLGMVALFAGEPLGRQLFSTAVPPPLASVWGVALVGLGLTNWIAKGSILGGIYGKAVVVGNHAHFLGGSLVLLSSGDVVRSTPVYWVVTGIYLFGATLFTYLTLSSGVRRPG